MSARVEPFTCHLSKIRPPSHPLILPVWDAFQKIPFTQPPSIWLSPRQFDRYALFNPIHVWRRDQSGVELLSGFRTYNLALAGGISQAAVTEYSDLSDTEALVYAIESALFPLLAWSHGGKQSSVNIAQFIKSIRHALPPQYNGLLPKLSDVRDGFNLSVHAGRKQVATPSRLTKLRQSLRPINTNEVDPEEQ